jgi:hypothetical protein
MLAACWRYSSQGRNDAYCSSYETSYLEHAISSLPQFPATLLGVFCPDAYSMLDTETTELSVETGLPVPMFGLDDRDWEAPGL